MKYEEWLVGLHPSFPQLDGINSQLTSPVDDGYNCIAWAAEDSGRWWWPDVHEQNYWPDSIPRVETIDVFITAFATLGYDHKSNATFESGIQKVAIFANDHGKPTHAARQLANGKWTSKLGPQIDIEHDLNAIEGPAYGKVAVVLARSDK